MHGEATATWKTYTGLFLVTLTTLMYEVLLTRIFSVTMWYHYAFVAISVAMFGMSVGAIVVYLYPGYFTAERAKHHLALSSLLFGGSILFSFLTHLCIPFTVDRSITGLYSVVLTYSVISVPFVFSGICVCLALTKFPRQVSKLYAADLAGAGLGCVLLIYLLRITDGPTAVIAVSALGCIGAAFFASEIGSKKLGQIAIASSLLLVSFATIHTFLVAKQFPLLRLIWVKYQAESRPLYEKWNSFSRIRVFGDSQIPGKPIGWGLSDAYSSDRKVRQLHMDIDAAAGTVMTFFDGNFGDLEHLQYDVTNIVHYVKRDGKVLVVGTGGGRDVLSALAFHQRAVVGVEINENIISSVNARFGDFTGHLDRVPNVTFVNDEARSYVARSKDRFDIIQVSLIDTFAATAAGAFVLAENSLYTVEAWQIFLGHLTDDGVLTFSRWYVGTQPAQAYRLVSLAAASLAQLGVQNPRDHIVLVRHMRQGKTGGEPGEGSVGVGTILVKKRPFSDNDLDTLEAVSRRMHFDVVLSPRVSLDPTFAKLAEGKDLDTFTATFPVNIAPPTDDTPFFFNMLRLRNAFSKERGGSDFINRVNLLAVAVLAFLLITVVCLTLLCIIVPLFLTTEKGSLAGSLSLFLFFLCIGLGFMLVEISQMQRLMIFLGHPTYGLSVVLFALLLSSGVGSFSTEKVDNPSEMGGAKARLLLLMTVLLLFGILTPQAIHSFQGTTTPLRILIATAILCPIGFFMGMPFPLGMKLAASRSPAITPWLWGMNGAASVCASVLAVVIALAFAISTTFWTGVACYVIGFVAFLAESRRRAQRAQHEAS